MSSLPPVQVPTEHYYKGTYDHKARWLSYWYQIRAVLDAAPASVLEVGPGGGVVTRYLKDRGVAVRTLDIDATLTPDIVGSVTAIPLADGTVEVALAAEVLEHIPFAEVPVALAELRRVATKRVVISVPDARRTLLAVSFHIPGLGRKELFLKTQSRRPHVFDGQHHWEIGKRGFPVRRVLALFPAAGLRVVRHFVPPDCPTKHFFILERTTA